MSQILTSRGSVLDVTRRAAFRPVLLLVSAFLAVSTGMLVFLAGASAAGAGIDGAIWTRCSFVVGSAIVLLLLAVYGARGARRAFVRLRIVSPVVVAAIVVIVSIPGFLPDWVRFEQAVCGILVLPVAILVNLPRIRSLFAARV
jgi:hypothetical protein